MLQRWKYASNQINKIDADRIKKEEMVKVKPNINCCEVGAPARSLRSRKRISNHETFQTVEATKHPQDPEEKDGVVAVLEEFPLPECFVVIDQQAQAVGQSCLTKQHLSAEEKPTDATNEATDVHLTTETVPQQKETTATNPNSDSQPKVSEDHTDGEELKSGQDGEEVAVEEHPACTDHLQIVQIAEEVNGSCEAASEKPLCATVNHQSHSEENEEASCNQASDPCLSEFKETLKESTAGGPPKKKRRMGMCGLTGKERSHFLLAQKRDNGTVSTEKQGSEKPAEESLPSPCLPSLPPAIPEETQSGHCGDLVSSETDAHINATTSGGADTVSDPEGTICETEPAAAISSEEIHQPKPDQLVKEDKNEEEEEGEPLASRLLRESKQSLTESEIREKQVKVTEAENSNGCCDSDVANHTSSREERSSQDAVEEAVPPVNNVTERQEEGKEEMPAGAVCSSPADTQAGDIHCGSAEISDAAATPIVSERTDQSDPDAGPAAGPASANAGRTHTTDPLGSTCSDYVSDSQLNTIELRVEKEKESSGHHEDGTNLICGLIRELSSLNRNVMAAHRELEVFHRRGKSSRNFLR